MCLGCMCAVPGACVPYLVEKVVAHQQIWAMTGLRGLCTIWAMTGLCTIDGF